MNAFEMFNDVLKENPDRTAVLSGIGDGRQSLTYGELQLRVDQVASTLTQHGLKAGDRVLLSVPMSIETYIVMLALLKAGMVTMIIDPGHGAGRIASILRAWPPAAIVSTRTILLFRFLMPEMRAIPRRFVVNGVAGGAISLATDAEDQSRFDTVPRSSADSALLTFTSGSTGEPKPVVRSHGFLQHQIVALLPVAKVIPGDIDFVAMPLFVLFNLANGVTSVLPACDIKRPGKADPRVILAQINGDAATRIVASPALLDRLASYCIRKSRAMPSLRRISTGGGPVPPGLPCKLKRVAPAASICMVYGSTEAEPIAAIEDHEVSVTAGRQMRSGAGLLVGRPVEGCAVKIFDSQPSAAAGPFTHCEFEHVCVPDGSIGEIVVSGKHVLHGYADATRNRETKIAVDGQTWHRTGDAGYFDDSGRLWLVGRCSAAITDRFGSVYPFQVEYAMSGTDGVRRAALISRGGERVLVLETRGREFETDRAAAGQCIANHRIDRIVTLRKIPVDRRHDAKVDYPALHRLLEGKWARARLYLAESISAVFRCLRRTYRSICNHCNFARAATKVRGWRLKTH